MYQIQGQKRQFICISYTNDRAWHHSAGIVYTPFGAKHLCALRFALCSASPSAPRSNLHSLPCASTDSLRLIITPSACMESAQVVWNHSTGMYEFLYSKPSPVGEGGIRAFASMTDEVFAFSSSNSLSGIPCPDTSSTASGPPSPTGEGFLKINAKRCMESADRLHGITALPCMESGRSLAWNHRRCIKSRLGGVSTQVLPMARYARLGGVCELDARRLACASRVRHGVAAPGTPIKMGYSVSVEYPLKTKAPDSTEYLGGVCPGIACGKIPSPCA